MKIWKNSAAILLLCFSAGAVFYSAQHVFNSSDESTAVAQQPQTENGQRPRRQMPSPEEMQKMRERYKPSLYITCPDNFYNPDGMTVCKETGLIYINCPNFNKQDEKKQKANSAQGGYLATIDKEGKLEIILEYPVLEETGQTGPMGIAIGPDKNLYVCDNQFFYNKDAKSRILRVVMKDGKPTGEVQTVIQGLHLPNAIQWYDGNMYFTDTQMCFAEITDEIIGVGGVFKYTGEEVLKAGTEGTPCITAERGDKDAHVISSNLVKKVGRADDGGADGLCIDKNGVIYYGNFGNGEMYSVIDVDGKYVTTTIYDVTPAMDKNKKEASEQPAEEGRRPRWNMTPQTCCDGIYYDEVSDRIFINDSEKNAINFIPRVTKPGEKVFPRTLWSNGDTDGADGMLDQPCECVVRDGKLIIACFDWPFPGLTNTKVDDPSTICVIDISKLPPVRPFGQRPGQGQPGERPARPNQN